MDLQELIQSKPATRQASKNDEKFVELIEKFEAKYRKSSAAEIYRDAKWIALRVIASVLFCDRFLLFLALVFFLLLCRLPYGSLITGAVAGVFVLLFSIYLYNMFQFGPSDQVTLRIKRKDAPRLFDLIDDVSKKMKIPVHRVFLVPVHNAFAAYTRRWLFWKTNDLWLGWPMMMITSEKELVGLLGHEIFHFSKYQSNDELLARATMASWRLSSSSFLKSQQNWHRNQYQKLAAYLTVLGKRNEILADESAMRLASPSSEATHSVRIAVVSHYIDEHSLMSKKEFAYSAKQPPKNMMAHFQQEIQNSICDESTASKYFENVIKTVRSNWERHPTWLQRVSATKIDWGSSNFLQQVVNFQPAVSMFEDAGEIEDKLNEKVFKKMLPKWETDYQFEKQRQQHLVPAGQINNFADTMQHAYATMNRTELEHAEPWLKKAIEFKPESQVAQCYLAKIGLKKENAGAEGKLEEFVNSPSFIAANLAYEALFSHYKKTGNQAALTHLESKLDDIQERHNAIQKEVKPNFKRPFVNHDLIEASLENARKSFAKHKSIKRVYAGKQQLKSCPDTQFIVFAVKTPYFSLVDLQELRNQLVGEIYLGGAYFWVEVKPNRTRLQNKLIKLEDSEIYRLK